MWHFPCQRWLALGKGSGRGGGGEEGSGEGVEVELVKGEKKGGDYNKESGMYIHLHAHVDMYPTFSC